MTTLNLGELLVSLRGDTSGFAAAIGQATRGLDEVERSAKEAERAAQSFTSTLEGAQGALTAISAGAALATTGLVVMARSAVSAASDVAEQMNVLQVAFGDQLGATQAWAKEQERALGRSRFELLDYAAGLQAMLVPMTGSVDAAADMSRALSKLAVDMGSFWNAADADVLVALKAALVGETEPMRKFGVVMSEAAANAYLLRNGINTTMQKMTEQEKVLVRYRMLMEATSLAHDDAAKTVDSYANQTKALEGQLRNLRVEIGEALLPDALKLLEWARDAVSWFGQLTPESKKLGAEMIVVGIGLTAVVAAGTLLLAVIPSAIAGFVALKLAAVALSGWLTKVFFTTLLNLELAVGTLGIALTGLAEGALAFLAAAFWPVTIAVAALAAAWGALELAGVDVTGALRSAWQGFADWFEETWDRLMGKQKQLVAASPMRRQGNGYQSWRTGEHRADLDWQRWSAADRTVIDPYSFGPMAGLGGAGFQPSGAGAAAKTSGGRGRGRGKDLEQEAREVAEGWAAWEAIVDGWAEAQAARRKEQMLLADELAKWRASMEFQLGPATHKLYELTVQNAQKQSSLADALKLSGSALADMLSSVKGFAQTLGTTLLDAFDTASVAVSAVVDAVSTGDVAMGLAVFATRLLESSEGFRGLTAAMDTAFVGLANIFGAGLEVLIPFFRAVGSLFEAFAPLLNLLQGPFLWVLEKVVNGLVIFLAGIGAVGAGIAEFITQIGNIFTGDADFGRVVEAAGESFNRTMLAAAGITSESLYGLGEATDNLRSRTDSASEALDQFTERLLNVPSGYRVARAQYAAQEPMPVWPTRIYTWEGVSGGN